MALSPFYRVLVAKSGRDLTDLITAFTYEDCTEEDDLVRFTLGGVPLALVDDKELQPGVKLLFSFGYQGGASSPQYTAVIVGTEPDFGPLINLIVLATHSGVATKKSNEPTLYQGKTSSQIAEAIAKKHNLKAQVDATSFVWQSVPTAGKTDYQLLKYLATHEQSGLYQFRIKGDTLIFTKRNLKKPSRRTFTYGDGNGTVVSFRPKNNDLHKKGTSAKTSVPGVDAFTGVAFKRDAADGKTKDDTKLGTYRVSYDQDGNRVGTSAIQPGTTIVVPSRDAAGADNVASKQKKDSGLDDITATLVVEGDPNLLADEVYTIAGVTASYGGNWYAKKVTHTINPGSPYTCTVEMGRNATDKAPATGAAKNDDKNTAAGPAKTDAGRDVRVKFDQNANRVK
jgi:phage protein D